MENKILCHLWSKLCVGNCGGKGWVAVVEKGVRREGVTVRGRVGGCDEVIPHTFDCSQLLVFHMRIYRGLNLIPRHTSSMGM